MINFELAGGNRCYHSGFGPFSGTKIIICGPLVRRRIMTMVYERSGSFPQAYVFDSFYPQPGTGGYCSG